MVILSAAKQIKLPTISQNKDNKIYFLLCSTSFYFAFSNFILLYSVVYLDIFYFACHLICGYS